MNQPRAVADASNDVDRPAAKPPPTRRERPAAPAALAGLALLVVVPLGDALGTPAKPDRAAARFDASRTNAAVDHPYFPLVPGSTLRFVEKLGKHVSDIEVAVTGDSKQILGASCVVVRERVHEKGTLTQETITWYAQDARGNVWILGEDSRELLGRGRVNAEGSWQAGVDGAEPGIVMPAEPSPGEPFRHGYLAGVAEDRAQIVAVADSVTVPFGSFGGCVKMKEWSMLESGTDKKWYARGIGLVRAESAAREVTMLVSVSRP